jgi:polysaccharide biosynthesis transport protein
MSEQIFSSAEEPEGKLPFSPRTLLLGLWRRWYIWLICAVLGVGGGLAAGYMFGEETYKTTAVLLYKKKVDAQGKQIRSELSSLRSMVTITTNLEELRQRLQMVISIPGLADMIEVKVQRGTDLLNITATSTDPQETADIVNTLREVFINNQRVIRRTLIGISVRDLEEKLEGVKREYNLAATTLEKFKAEYGIGNLNAEAAGYAQRYSELQQLFEKASIDLNSGRLSQGEAAFEEGGDLAAGSEGLSSTNVKIQTLLKSMQNDQQLQQRSEELASRERDLQLAQRMFDLGLIPEVQYRNAENAYENLLNSMEDSETVKVRKEALTSALAERLKHIEKARDELRTKMSLLPTLQGEFAEYTGLVTFWGGQRRSLEETLAKTRRDYQSNLSDFTLIREAPVPRTHDSSTKRIIAISIAVFGGIFGVILILGLELSDTRIKAGAEVSLKLNLPLLGVFPKLPSDMVFPRKGETELVEPARIMARHVRRASPKRGTRILVVGAKHGEGTTSAAANLAICFGRQDERVLLVDAQVRDVEPDHELKDLVNEGEDQVKGLGEYLSFEVDDTEDIIWATQIPGVECIPRIGEAVIPDLVGSNRMRELLEDVSERFSIVLIDTPPVLPYVDAEVLAQWADAIIFVVKSRSERVGTIREAIERLKVAQLPIIGVVLNGVESLYIEKV